MTNKSNYSIIEEIKAILINRNETVSVAESLTSGMLQANFAKVSGISKCFEGGITAYSLNKKVLMLNVDRKHASQVNCVSERVAEEMATGIAKYFSTELSISTTGYAEPYLEKGITEAHAYICVNYKGTLSHSLIKAPQNQGEYMKPRENMRKHVTNEALILALNAIK